jgi:hypothetical protein
MESATAKVIDIAPASRRQDRVFEDADVGNERTDTD